MEKCREKATVNDRNRWAFFSNKGTELQTQQHAYLIHQVQKEFTENLFFLTKKLRTKTEISAQHCGFTYDW